MRNPELQPAGKADKKGNYPPGTVYGEVQKKLKTYLERSRKIKQEFEDQKE